MVLPVGQCPGVHSELCQPSKTEGFVKIRAKNHLLFLQKVSS